MLVRWTAGAATDLERISDYIHRDSPDAASDVTQRIYDCAESLNESPRRGRVGITKNTRELLVSGLPYVIVYRVSEVAVELLHIDHLAQHRLGIH